MKQPEKLSEIKKEKIEALRKMMQNPFAKDLKKLTEILRPSGEAMTLKNAAQETGISEEGIKTIKASTVNELEIFPEEKGGKEIWYIKIREKQPKKQEAAILLTKKD